MSTTDLYFTAPLCLLHRGAGAVDVLERCLSCGIVNAGIGHRKMHGESAFQTRVLTATDAARSQGLPTECPGDVRSYFWQAALAGAQILGVRGGSCAQHAAIYQAHLQPGAVFFRLRADWLWGGLYTARKAAGDEVPAHPYKPLSWREFRILAAILSAKVNTYGFTFLGWESIQARACGYHSKALFQAGKATLPPHCQPLSRDVIRAELDKLEALGFFARCRYAKGARGGLMAYSFRHQKREGLADAIKCWAADNHAFQAKAAAHRAADLAAFAE